MTEFKDKILSLLEVYVLPFIVVFYTLGMIVASQYSFPLSNNALIIMVVVILIFFSLAIWKKYVLLLALPFFLIGGTIYSYAVLSQDGLTLIEGKELEMTGYVTRILDENTYSMRFYFQPDDMYNYDGELLVYADPVDITYGSNIMINGVTIRTEESLDVDNFDYDVYLSRHGVTGQVDTMSDGYVEVLEGNSGSWLIRLSYLVRERLVENFYILTDDQASYVKGMLFGDKADLEDDNRDVLEQSGIMHVFAVSGLHIGFILAFFLAIAKKLPMKRWQRVILVAFLLIVYAGMTGFTPSVTRACIMGVVGLLAYYYGAEENSLIALSLALGVTLTINPLLLYDAGFLMSFAAVSSIIATKDIWQKYGKSSQLFVVAIMAQLGVLPLLAYYFNIVTLGGLILAPFALLITGAVVIIGFLSLPLSFIGLGGVAMYLCGVLVDLLYQLATWVSSVVFFWRDVATPSLFLMLIYVLAFVLCIILCLKFKNKKFDLVALLAVVAIIVVPTATSLNNLEITVLDVGQGMAIHIQTPEGQNILIDAGGSSTNLSGYAESTILPYFAINHIYEIDYLICSHPHEDHIGGLFTIATSMQVNGAYTLDVFSDYYLQIEWEELLTEEGIPITYLEGKEYTIENDLTLTVIAPSGSQYGEYSLNEGSLVAILTYKDFDFLITSDLEGDQLDNLIIDNASDIEVIYLPHHGSKYSHDEDIWDLYDPDAVVISVGEDNAFGHPGTVVIDYWDEREVPLYRTDDDGSIKFITDGESLSIDYGF